MLFSTWEWIRILGFLAYFYFTIAISFGLLRKSSFVKSHKNLIYQIHLFASWMGFITIIGHMLILMIDSYQTYTIKDLLVPFSTEYAPITSGLGTIAFYLFFTVIFTSDVLIKRLKRNIWKGIHFLVLPAWLISLIHGLFIGTDSGNMLVLMFYGVTAGMVLLIMAFRFMLKDDKPKTAANSKTPQKTRSQSTANITPKTQAGASHS